VEPPSAQPHRIFALKISAEALARTPGKLGDYVSYFHARQAFLTGVSQDPRIAAMLAEWAHHDGLAAKAAQVAGRANQLARVLGLPDRTALAAALGAKGGLRAEPGVMTSPRLLRTFDALNAASYEYERAFNEFMNSGWLVDQIRHYLEERDLCWDWLGSELADAFVGNLSSYALGRPEYVTLSMITHDRSQAPAVALEFASKQGESVAAARERLRLAAEEADRRLAAADDLGRLPKKLAATYEQYGGWLYRTAIAGESIRGVALSDLGSHERVGQVRRALKRTRALMALGDLIEEEDLHPRTGGDPK
jgi:hypothetical protein